MRLGMGLGLGNLLSGQPLTGFPNDFSFNFDGSNDYLKFEDEFVFSGAFTVSLWVKHNSSGDEYTLGKQSGDQDAFILHPSASRWKIANVNTQSNTSIVANQWHHILAVRNSSNLFKWYVNGSSATLYDGSSYVTTGVTRSGDFDIDQIGRVGSALYGEVQVDEVAFWDTALSASDIAKIASKPVDFSKASTYATDRTANLKLWLRCGDKAEPESNTAIARQDFYTDFDGTDDYIQAEDDDSLDITGSWSLSAWINIGSGTSGFDRVIGKQTTGGQCNYGIGLKNGTDFGVFINDGSGFDDLYHATDLTVGRWYHGVGTWDGSYLKVYLDGKLVETSSDLSSANASVANTAPLLIGRNSTNGDQYFKGQMSSASVYQTALDAQTISQFAKSRFTPMRDNRFSVVDFDGSNDYIQIPDSDVFDVGGALTLTMWFKTETSQSNKTLFSFDHSSFKILLQIEISSGRLNLYIVTASGTSNVSVTDTFNGRGWTYITCTFDKALSSNRLKMYIDGVEQSAVDAYAEDILAGDDGIRIGNYTTGYVTAQIASTGFYNTAKSAEEVYALYSKGITYNESSELGLVGLWRMGSDTSKAYPTIADSSSNSNDGTITNGASDDIVQQMVAGYDMGAFESTGEELGGEIASNNFGGWTLNGWTDNGDNTASANNSSGGNQDLTISYSFTASTLYKITATFSNISGNFHYSMDGTGGLDKTITTNGEQILYVKISGSGASSFFIRSKNGSSATISNVSIKEVLQSADLSDTYPAIIDVNEPVLGADVYGRTNSSSFTAGSGAGQWSGGTVTSSSVAGGATLNGADPTLSTSVIYRVQFTCTVTSGSFDIRVGSTSTGTNSTGFISSSGTYGFNIIAGASNHDVAIIESSWVGSITSFSIKEVQGNVGTMTNQDSADLVYSSVLPDQSFLTGVNSAYNFIDLDGSDAFINCGGDIDVVGAFAISAWVNSDVIATSLRSIASQGNSFFGFGDASAGKLLFQGQGSSANNLQSQTALTADTWFHIVLSVSGTNAGDGAIYVNGSRDDDGESTVFLTAGDFVIGKMPTASSRYWNGKITQVAIYNKALTSIEVSGIYNLGRHGNLLDSYSDNLKGYWVMGGLDSKTGLADTDSTIYDRSGNSNHGTTSGTATGDLKSPPNAEPEGYAKGDTNRSTTTP